MNGETIAVAGLDEFGVITTIVNWVRRNPEKVGKKTSSEPGFDPEPWLKEELTLHVGGLDSKTDENVVWVQDDLAIGDEILIRLLPEGIADPPTRREPWRDPRSQS